MAERNEQQHERGAEGSDPTRESRAQFAGDATGAVGGSIAPTAPPDTLQHAPHAPDPHKHDPGKAGTDIEDAGWVKEGQGSQLAQEREGVPERAMPHNIPKSAAHSRPKA